MFVQDAKKEQLNARSSQGPISVLGPDRLRRFHVAALDSQTGPVAAGISFGREVARPTVRQDDLPGWKRPNETFNDSSYAPPIVAP